MVIKKGLIWQVGDAIEIFVRNDYWVPYETPRSVLACDNFITEVMRVCELFDRVTGLWDEDKIKRLFPPFECNLIMSIPISRRFPKDRQIWSGNRNGYYSVKSGYRLLCSSTSSVVGGNSSFNFSAVWKKLLHLDISRKIILLAWRALRGILPTRTALIRRQINVEEICIFFWY